MALAFAGKAVASSAISATVRKSFDYLEKYTKLEGMESVQERLESTLPQVEVVFDAIDMEKIRGRSEALDAWFWQLRDAVEEAEDVLDEVEYYKLEKKVETSCNDVSSFLYKCKRTFIQQFNATFNVGTYKKMVDAMKKLDEVAAAVERFRPFFDHIDSSSSRHISHQQTSNSHETSSFLLDEMIIGRDTEKDQIVEWLVKQESDDHQSLEACTFTIFALVGIGGMGKTTLVRSVYNDQRLKQCFDQVMWVCVSKEFDVHALTRMIVEEANGSTTGVTGLNGLQKILQEKLSSKKFLLVFDDVWNDTSTSDWETLLAPLKCGQVGSKILLTTRMQSVVDTVERVLGGRTKSLRLEGLQDKDLLVLLNKHAFFRVNPNDYMNLQEVGEKIIKRLSGCPLAAKVLGGMLNSSMDSIHWNKILQENIHNTEDGNGFMELLRLSYNHLPAHLRACFRYCSIFREDYRFSENELVNLWMGSGLIQNSSDECRRPEDIGESYLDILTSKSFFELRSHDPHNYNFYCTGESPYKYYLMHDLLHELACSVSKKESLRVSSDNCGTIPATVRHISIDMINHSVITDFSRLKKLRTLFIYFNKTADGRVQWHVLKNVLKVTKKLRVLRVNQFMNLLEKLPKEFDTLIHLRCLFVLCTGVRCPSSVYKLYHLEMFRFNGCLWDSSQLRNLINLRRLDYSGIQAGSPPHIGHLTSLQHLKVDLKYERMSEIRDLNDLRCLDIVGTQNSNMEDSKLAKLAEKKNLIKLSLSWDNSTCESGTEELLLDNLQPHTSLTELKMEGYSGTRSPCWMGHPVISNLVYIKIYNCRNWQNLPALGRLPALKYLHLISMYAVKRIDHSFYGCEGPPAFPSLELLFLCELPALEEWAEMEGRNVFPQLKTLCIEYCKALRNMPALPPIVANFQIMDVGLDTFPAICQSSETALCQKPLLSSLKISGCPNLVTLTQDQEYCFRSLEELRIENCENLLHFPVDRLHALQFLTTFSLVNCPKLMAPNADVSLPSSVRKLHIRSCGAYETSLLNSLCSLTSLSTLRLQYCVMTAPTPDDISFPSSIRNIYISSLGVYENRLLNSMCSLSSLHTISLSNCVMTAFPSAQVFRSLTTVQSLEIIRCNELASLNGIEELTSLAKLIVIRCDKLIGIPCQQMHQTPDLSQLAAVFPSHMRKLRCLRISDPFLLSCEPLRRVNSVINLTIDKIWNCLPEEWLIQNCNSLKILGVFDASQLEFLPSTVARLSSLETMEFKGAILIQSLPELPASLRRLQFLGSHPVLLRRCQKKKGHDWHKIAHIRTFQIERYFPSGYVWSSFQSLRPED